MGLIKRKTGAVGAAPEIGAKIKPATWFFSSLYYTANKHFAKIVAQLWYNSSQFYPVESEP